MDDHEGLIVALGGFAVLVLVIIFCAVRIERVAVIEARWWTYDRSYTYTTTETRPVTRTNTWTDAKGNTHTDTTVTIETYTETHTRCSAQSQGTELPPMPPQMPCTAQAGDGTTNSVAYHVTYHEEEKDESKHMTIGADAWDDFEPHRVIHVKLTLWQRVTKYDVIKEHLLFAGRKDR